MPELEGGEVVEGVVVEVVEVAAGPSALLSRLFDSPMLSIADCQITAGG